jgi:hypothetical protein
MKQQPKWLRQAIRDAHEAWLKQDDIINTEGYNNDKYLYAQNMTLRAMEHAKLMEHRWQSMTPSEQWKEIHDETNK